MPAILIECLQRRPKGQNVHFTRDSTAYSFEDRGTGQHLAVVEDPAHQRTFLGIPEGFVFAGTAPEGMKPSIVSGVQPTGPAAEALERATPRRPEPVMEDGDEDAPMSAEEQALALLKARPELLAQLLGHAAPAPAPALTPVVTSTVVTTLPEPDRVAVDAAPADLPGEDALNAMSLADLRMQFKAETGKNASPKNNEAVLVAKIMAEREARGA